MFVKSQTETESGLEALLQTLQALTEDVKSKGERVAFTITSQQGAGHSTSGFFEYFKVNKDLQSGLILSIQVKFEGRIHPVTILPGTTIKIIVPDQHFSGVASNEIIVEEDGDVGTVRRSYERARRRSVIENMRRASGASHEEVHARNKFRYYDRPSSKYAAGTLHTEEERDFQQFAIITAQTNTQFKKNFFVRNHREMAAALLFCIIVVILGISLHFGFFVKDLGTPDPIITTTTDSQGNVCANPDKYPAVSFTMQLHGTSKSYFTTTVLASLTAVIRRFIVSDGTLCIDLAQDVAARRASLSIDLQLIMRFVVQTPDVAASAVNNLRSADWRSSFQAAVSAQLSTVTSSNITVAQLLLAGEAPAGMPREGRD
jgi:hypothetical protein